MVLTLLILPRVQTGLQQLGEGSDVGGHGEESEAAECVGGWLGVRKKSNVWQMVAVWGVPLYGAKA
jgi:hypothetical protein